MQRILVFSEQGEYLWALRDTENMSLPGGVAVAQNIVHVVDAVSGRTLVYDVNEIAP
jgi:hypothetical protein